MGEAVGLPAMLGQPGLEGPGFGELGSSRFLSLGHDQRSTLVAGQTAEAIWGLRCALAERTNASPNTS